MGKWVGSVCRRYLITKLIFKFGQLTLSALTSDDGDVIPNGDGGNEIRLRVNKGSWVGIAKISSTFGGLHEPVQFANI